MMPQPKKVLMVSPETFDVQYAINAHMTDESGQLHKINKELAVKQWHKLKSVYERLGFFIKIIPGHEEFPDMVFCANQSFPFLAADGTPSVILSHMASRQRRGEVEVVRQWFEEARYKIYDLVTGGAMEGSGDLLWDLEGKRLFAGHGFRTIPLVLDEVEDIVGVKSIRLHLQNPKFYHLDTCLAIFNTNCAAYVPEAFSDQDKKTLQKAFKDLIAVDLTEAEKNFACNAHSPDGKNVLIQSGSSKTKGALLKRGFQVHEVDTSEFIKAGGSVFCMKQMIW